jgi:hypothetical protein
MIFSGGGCHVISPFQREPRPSPAGLGRGFLFGTNGLSEKIGAEINTFGFDHDRAHCEPLDHFPNGRYLRRILRQIIIAGISPPVPASPLD